MIFLNLIPYFFYQFSYVPAKIVAMPKSRSIPLPKHRGEQTNEMNTFQPKSSHWSLWKYFQNVVLLKYQCQFVVKTLIRAQSSGMTLVAFLLPLVCKHSVLNVWRVLQSVFKCESLLSVSYLIGVFNFAYFIIVWPSTSVNNSYLTNDKTCLVRTWHWHKNRTISFFAHNFIVGFR